MRAAGVGAVSPAKRGRSEATRLDAGEHTVMLTGPTAGVSIIDALPFLPDAGAWLCFAAANGSCRPWAAVRSRGARPVDDRAAAVGSRKTSDHRANGRFVVTTRLRRS